MWPPLSPEMNRALDLIRTRLSVVVERIGPDRWRYERMFGPRRVISYGSERALIQTARQITHMEERLRHGHFWEKWGLTGGW